MSIPQIVPYDIPTLSELPSSRLKLQFDPHRAALLIHDVQDYFLDFFGASNSTVAGVVDNIVRLRAACYAWQIPVVYTAQPPVQSAQDRGLLLDMWGPGITAHPTRASIRAELTPNKNDVVLTKHRYSAFARTPLWSWLGEHQKTQLIVCGVYAHIGVQCTAADAFMSDLVPFIISDAVADFTREKHVNALSYIANCCGVVQDTEYLLSRLTTTVGANGPQASAAFEAELRRDVASILELGRDAFGADTNLFDLGLDSVRLLTLVEQWRGRGYAAELLDLADTPTLDAWTSKLRRPHADAE